MSHWRLELMSDVLGVCLGLIVMAAQGVVWLLTRKWLWVGLGVIGLFSLLMEIFERCDESAERLRRIEDKLRYR